VKAQSPKIVSFFTALTLKPRYIQSRTTLLYGGLALGIGLASGIGVYIFKFLIDYFNKLFFTDISDILTPWINWGVLFLPILGGLLVGLVRHFFVGEEKYHGVAGIMEATALTGGRLRYNRIPAKTIASALSIGSGASVGPEDPSVQIGASIGSMVGQKLRLSDDTIRTLVAGGAAAGIAAAFNAPIAGVFFALEVILGQIGATSMGAIVISAVASAVVTQALSGSQPAFIVPKYAFNSAWELPLYFGLGLLAGPLAALYVRLVYLAQDMFKKWRFPNWLKPAVAGVAIGFTGIFLPQVFGVGYESIEKILGGENLGVLLLIALVIAKLILTPISIGGGFMGGVFAPSLFLGAMLGAAYGTIAGSLLPGMALSTAAFGMVGMAAVLAGAVHAPLTAIILLFEMTNDYRIILPLMFSVVVSMLISQILQRDSVYTLGLTRKGIRLNRGRDIEVLQAIKVEEVMQAHPPVLLESDSLEHAEKIFNESKRYTLPVINLFGDLCGVLTIRDLERAHEREQPADHIFEIFTRNPVTAFPDENINQVLLKMSPLDLGRLPVVSREKPTQLIGWLRRNDILHAYEIAITRQAALRHSVHQVRLDAFSSDQVNVMEVTVQPNSYCANHLVNEVNFPKESMIATLRRGRRTIIPRGDTLLRAGDVLIVVAEGEAKQVIQGLCNPQADDQPNRE
jgi:CIC family chloride channel protein